MREPPDHPEPHALLAGTLCLMSCAGACEAPLYVRRIVANLERIAIHPAVTAELRIVCRRLAAQWEERLSIPGSPTRGPTPVH